MGRERLKDIDKAKGVAIFLVVLGHITLSSPPKDADWFNWIRIAIYKFHMPFFMYLSGYAMYYVLPKIESLKEFYPFIKKKAFRLIPPLLIFGVLIGVGKYAMQQFIHVDKVPDFSYWEFAKILIEPDNSFARSIWYIYVLFLYYLTIPLLLILANYRLLPLLFIGILLQFITVTDYIILTDLFALNSYSHHLLFFIIGMLSVKYRIDVLHIFDKYKFIWGLLFLSSFVLLFLDIKHRQSMLIISLLSIPALHAIFATKLFDNNKQVFQFAKYTFVIYLLNTIIIGLTKGIILKFFSWDGYRFLMIAPIITIVGIYGPIIIKRYMFSKIKYLDKITN